MSITFYSIMFWAKCKVLSLGEGNERSIAVVNDLRPNLYFEGNYYPCRALTEKGEIKPGETGEVKIHAIPSVPMGIKVGSTFELRAAKMIFAECEVLEILENEEKTASK